MFLKLLCSVACALQVCAQILPEQAKFPEGTNGKVSWLPLRVSQGKQIGFAPVLSAHSQIQFTNVLSELDAAKNRVLETGSGVAAGDFDGDGRVDLFFASLSGDCRLYRNLGDLMFEDVTKKSGINCLGLVCRGAVFADVNGDGRLDLLVSAMGRGVLCFINRGEGRFEDATAAAGAASPFASMTIACADVDGNGTLDFYVTNYRTNDVRDAGRVDLQSVNGQTVVPRALQNRFLLVEGKVQEYGEPDLLYLNDGKGHFTPVSWIAGAFRDEEGKNLTRAPMDWGLSAAFCDLNGDGHPDLYVCNDYWTPDRIWINDGKGHFQAIGHEALRHTSASSMGVDFADIDRDGKVDFFVVDMLARAPAKRIQQMPSYTGPPSIIGQIYDRPQINRNTLFHNRGDGTFAEIAEFAGLDSSEWSWQPLFLDVDLDGYPDLLIASGHTKAVQEFDPNDQVERTRPKWRVNDPVVDYNGTKMPFQEAFTAERMRQLRLYRSYESPLFAFRNEKSLKFSNKTDDWGLNAPAIRHGFAFADLDNDGDMDLVINPLNSPAELWINLTSAPRVAVELMDNPDSPGAGAVGAKLLLRAGTLPLQTAEVVSGGRYLSGSQQRYVFAAGSGAMQLEVVWRNGAKTIVPAVQPDRLYRVAQAGQ